MLKLFIALFSIISTKALANPACAVCTVAVGASLEVARRLGVDDSVVGVWSGAMLALVGFWSLSWFDKKNWHFKGCPIWQRFCYRMGVTIPDSCWRCHFRLDCTSLWSIWKFNHVIASISRLLWILRRHCQNM